MSPTDAAWPTDPQSPLACTVRGCDRTLVADAAALRCAAGHAFDRARSGYVNLLQPTDRRSLAAGDSPAAVAARARLEVAGHEAGLVARLVALARELGVEPGAWAVDVGSGTGRIAGALSDELGARAVGVDLSAAACELAARRHPEALFAVANADRRLPFRDAGLDLACSCRGPRAVPELGRTLRPGALFLLALPAPDDQVELRAAVLGEARAVEREAAARALFEPAFEMLSREEHRVRERWERPALEDLLLATYRGARRSQRARAEALESLELTSASLLLAWRRPRGRRRLEFLPALDGVKSSDHGTQVAPTALVRLKPLPQGPAGSRYHHW
jgi:23S rRNA (guanine745-N1)-methyltransferase